jgi:flagellar motor switch protein FliM
MESIARRLRFGGALQLPAVRVAAAELETLEPGAVLRLDLAANTLPVWKVGGQALAEAAAVAEGAHRGARMEQMVEDRET